jgi:hypothetical protein
MSPIIFAFGDQAAFNREDLRPLVLRGGEYVHPFLSQTLFALRREINSLPWDQREQFPTFSTFLELLDIDNSKPLHPGLQVALSCIYQFAVYLA